MFLATIFLMLFNVYAEVKENGAIYLKLSNFRFNEICISFYKGVYVQYF